MEKFFMRFYGQSDANIKKCISELKKNFDGIKKVKIAKTNKSMNLLLSSLDIKEVLLHFDTKEKLAEFMNDDSLRGIYQQARLK